jgi:hypothetical protein
MIFALEIFNISISIMILNCLLESWINCPKTDLVEKYLFCPSLFKFCNIKIIDVFLSKPLIWLLFIGQQWLE